MKNLLLLVAALCLQTQTSFAVEEKKIGIHFNGFIQLDMFHDSTRSLTEIPGNNPIDPAGTVNGENGRFQMSARASRFKFTVDGPEMGTWQTKGLLEWDFFGSQPATTENAFFSAGLPRVRHLAMFISRPGWEVIAGQYWSLFGNLDYYLPSTVAFRPPVGALLARTAQLRVTHDIIETEDFKSSLAVAISRPTQRDSEIPNLDFSARIFYKGLQSIWAIPFRPAALQPAQASLSGTLRNITNPTGVTTKHAQVGHGLTLNFLIPVLPAKDLQSSSMTWSGEITNGRGLNDYYPGLTFNLPSLATSATTPTQPNLDAGIGGMRLDNGQFELSKVWAANTTLQFHLPADWHTFFNIYLGTLQSSNAAVFTPTAGKAVYTQMHSLAANVFHDFNASVRAGLEFMHTKTNYVGAPAGTNNRIQLSGWFSF